MVATQHNNSMVETQHGSSAKHGTNIGHSQVKKVETTIHHTKQPQLSVRVSMIVLSSNEEIEIKLSSLSDCCSSFQSLAAANREDERPRDVCALGNFKRM